MSKKAPRRKVKKRTLRTIRKTLGAICLITAIIVAAIPSPDLKAIGGTSGDTSAPDVTYSVSDNTAIPSIPTADAGGTKQALMLYQLSNGKWLLDWAYEYYTTSTDGYGVISKYNSAFTPQNGNLNIDVNVIKAYPKYTATDISTFYAANDGKTLSDNELSIYFPTEYQDYLDDLSAYEKNPVPPKPTLPVKLVSDLTEAQKMSYFCENTLYKSKSLEGYTLVEVFDMTGATTETAYIPQKGTTFFTADIDKEVIRYIGKNAFENATSVTTISIPSEVMLIGDSAFKNASGIRTLTVNSQTIGNHAFQGCSSLTSVTISGGTTIIGTEAFQGCNRLQSITLPYSIEEIGQGAFANCAYLSSLDMSGITRNPVIKEFAFYDCYALSNVKFCSTTSEIKTGAFAVMTGVSGTWTDVVFPTQAVKLGDYVLSGRSNIKTVVMPDTFGTLIGGNNTLGAGFFKGCINLQWVEFPDNKTGSCGYASFLTNAFIDVLTTSFYVRGPEFDVTGNPAGPRLASQAASIPYVYVDANGKECYEVGNGSYMFLVDEQGVLNSCDVISANSFDGEITVPSSVGAIKVTGISSDCFSDTTIHDNLTRLIFQDNSVSSIAASAFEGYPKLAYVQIGNSINNIGDRAFADCPKLTEVHFNTPSSGYSGFTIGTDAFSTGGNSLIFYGDINPNYAPFTWAMGADNYMDATKKIRVCYKTNAPTSLTVMRDNVTGLVTLLDYPHYEDIEDSVITAYEKIFIEGDVSGNYVISANDIERVKSTMNIVVPAGVQSIDSAAFMSAGENYNNFTTYIYDKVPNYETYKEKGLFNGFYGDGTSQREYPTGSSEELVDQGNDRILSITMTDVTKLPDQAFNSCENLQVVSLGNACANIGTAPFAGCSSLGSIAGNTYYTCENGIIYTNNSDGTKNIVECLSGRGDVVGQKYITTETDTNLASVTSLSPGAFQDCTNITRVDFSTLSKLLAIPKDCFDGCTNLRTVILPSSVNSISANAFKDTATGISVTIPGKEVQIDNTAFDAGEALIRTYTGTAAATYAKAFDHDLEIIDNIYTVYFLDYNGTELVPVQYIESGRSAQAPANPTRTGYTFSGWSKGYTTISSDTVIVALYTLNATTSGNSTTSSNSTSTSTTTTTSSNTTSQNSTSANGTTYKLTVDSGSGDGSYKQGVTVTIKADTAPTGKVFDKWTSSASDISIASSTSETTTIVMPAKDVTMTATYKTGSSTSSSSSGSTTVSGNASSGTTSGSGSGTTVSISKDGISNTDKASASVSGSTDNFVVKITDSDTARQEIEAALLNEYGSLDNIRYFPMDISLYDSTGTTKITDTTGLEVTITMPIPNDLITYAGNNKAASVVNEKLDKLSPRFSSIDGVSCITFTATHFSPYTIYVDVSNLTSGVTDATPKTGDGLEPKWFLVMGLSGLSMVLFLKKDKEGNIKTA